MPHIKGRSRGNHTEMDASFTIALCSIEFVSRTHENLGQYPKTGSAKPNLTPTLLMWRAQPPAQQHTQLLLTSEQTRLVGILFPPTFIRQFVSIFKFGWTHHYWLVDDGNVPQWPWGCIGIWCHGSIAACGGKDKLERNITTAPKVYPQKYSSFPSTLIYLKEVGKPSGRRTHQTLGPPLLLWRLLFIADLDGLGEDTHLLGMAISWVMRKPCCTRHFDSHFLQIRHTVFLIYTQDAGWCSGAASGFWVWVLDVLLRSGF